MISYNQLLQHQETAQDNDLGKNQELFRFRAIIGQQDPFKATDPDWNGSKCNVQVEWETGEVSFVLKPKSDKVRQTDCRAEI